MSRILVTGGAGYIGSVCSARLLQNGHSVVVVDDLSTGFRDAVPDGACFHCVDIGDRIAIREILNEYRPDGVFHFAAKSLIGESVSAPGFYFEQNVASGILLLEELRRANVRKFIFSSSAAVYGTTECAQILEDHRAAPVNPYGETKLMFERILTYYAHTYGWTVGVLRYFNACGAWKTWGERHDPETHIIPLLLRAAAGKIKGFKIYGNDYPTPDGTCLRDYVHVLDIADAHILLAQAMVDPGISIYNIGTGKSYSVKEVVELAESVTGKRISVIVSARRAGDPAVLCANPQKLARMLGWTPHHSNLRDIVGSAWEFQQNGG